MTPQRQVPPWRKTLYYVGMAVAALGLLIFISVFISGASHFGDFSDFAQRGRSMAVRAILGMLMFAGGGCLMRIGRMGLAGSGMKLDPEAARRDVEPWARMGGGIVKDSLDEAGINPGGRPPGEQSPFDERLRRVQKLRQDGLLSEPEFEATKKKILDEA